MVELQLPAIKGENNKQKCESLKWRKQSCKTWAYGKERRRR